MKYRLVFSALILTLAACSPTPTAVPSVATILSSSPTPAPVLSLPEEVTPTTKIPQTTVPEPSGALWLQILSPQDEAVVNTPQVEVIGNAAAGAVVSIDDEILLVGSDQHFKTTVALDEGPNLIEIVASDDQGNETFLLLAVTYEP
jgi:hypothetical protein